MQTELFDVQVPPKLIAQEPLEKRDESKLLVINREERTIEHGNQFKDLGKFLTEKDLLVFNNTRVINARLRGHKKESPMERITILLLHPYDLFNWEALIEEGEVKRGDKIVSGENTILTILEVGRKVGKRKERLCLVHVPDKTILDSYGEVPVPPYIHRYKGDPERYQTVYAIIRGSAAAPTAGLHFTNELLSKLSIIKGVSFSFVTLHIGIDTFMPILEDQIEKHKIHSEWCKVSKEVCDAIKETKSKGGKVVAVGTTVVRSLETSQFRPFEGWTSKYIYPGYKFKVVDGLITNFHYPKSTNLVLVSSFTGYDLLKKAYQEAVEKEYRFYSFGDAMLIL